MNPMKQVIANWTVGVAGMGITTAHGWVVEHYSTIIGCLTYTAGAVLTVISAINALNVWRDRRETKRQARLSQAQRREEHKQWMEGEGLP